VIYLGYQGVRHGRESYWLARFAVHLPDAYSPEQVEVLKKAYAAEPKNFDTTYAIGYAYKVQSHEGGENYKDLAGEAMRWFQRGMELNPWDGYNYLFYGWCLDWTGRQDKAGPYFDKAEQLDPNGYFTMAFIGLHFLESNNFAAAKPWFERSLTLEWMNNDVARTYMPIVNRKLLEDATNEISAKLSFPAPAQSAQ
jgi:tetratricopeptide (TPR) repeat protein